MSIQNTKKMIMKDINKIDKEIAKNKIYIGGIIKEQEGIIRISEREIRKTNKLLLLTKKVLEPYISMSKKFDDAYYETKRKYENLLKRRDALEKASVIASESITKARLSMV